MGADEPDAKRSKAEPASDNGEDAIPEGDDAIDARVLAQLNEVQEKLDKASPGL